MSEFYAWLDAWLSTPDGIFWAAVAGFVALSLIPLSVLIWALTASLRAFREERRIRRVREVEKAITGKVVITPPTK